MEKENVLLIGGPRDGEWVSIESGLREVRFTDLKQPIAYWEKADPHAAVEYVTHEYRRVHFQSDKGLKGSLFVFGDIDPIAALIEGYRKP